MSSELDLSDLNVWKRVHAAVKDEKWYPSMTACAKCRRVGCSRCLSEKQFAAKRSAKKQFTASRKKAPRRVMEVAQTRLLADWEIVGSAVVEI